MANGKRFAPRASTEASVSISLVPSTITFYTTYLTTYTSTSYVVLPDTSYKLDIPPQVLTITVTDPVIFSSLQLEDTDTATHSFSASTTTSIANSTQTASTENGRSSDLSSGLSVGTKAGIGVGVATGIILMMAIAFFCLRWRTHHPRVHGRLAAAAKRADGEDEEPRPISEMAMRETPSQRTDSMYTAPLRYPLQGEGRILQPQYRRQQQLPRRKADKSMKKPITEQTSEVRDHTDTSNDRTVQSANTLYHTVDVNTPYYEFGPATGPAQQYTTPTRDEEETMYGFEPAQPRS